MILIFFKFLFMGWDSAHLSTHVETGGQFARSLFSLLYEAIWTNSGHQTWWHTPLPFTHSHSTNPHYIIKC